MSILAHLKRGEEVAGSPVVVRAETGTSSGARLQGSEELKSGHALTGVFSRVDLRPSYSSVVANELPRTLPALPRYNEHKFCFFG